MHDIYYPEFDSEAVAKHLRDFRAYLKAVEQDEKEAGEEVTPNVIQWIDACELLIQAMETAFDE